MTKEEFYDIVSDLFVPLFTGSYLAGEIESSSRDLEVALGKSNSILLKPSRSDSYRLVLKRGQPFKTYEVNLIKSILNELNYIAELHISDATYLTQLRNMAIEKALVESITTEGANTVLGILAGLEAWAARTYEGEALGFGVLVNLAASSDEKGDLKYNKIMNNDFVSLFTDGDTSFIEFDINGNMLGYVSLKNPKKVATISPIFYDKVARVCNEKRVGLILTKQGDILIFYDRQLFFAKRNGNWCVYCHDEIIRLLQNNVSSGAKQIRRSIYNTALDCSFSYHGACIAYLDKDKTREALMHIDAADIISEDHFNIKRELELEEAGKLYNIANSKSIIEKYNMSYQDFLLKHQFIKTMMLRRVISGRKLFELDRQFIEEMASVDGAIVVDYDGTIIAVGAIIKIEAGSKGGGRLAATQTLGKYGVAIKVSQDGIMQGFTFDRKIKKVKEIFYVG